MMIIHNEWKYKTIFGHKWASKVTPQWMKIIGELFWIMNYQRII